jgi:hypothetical protein
LDSRDHPHSRVSLGFDPLACWSGLAGRTAGCCSHARHPRRLLPAALLRLHLWPADLAGWSRSGPRRGAATSVRVARLRSRVSFGLFPLACWSGLWAAARTLPTLAACWTRFPAYTSGPRIGRSRAGAAPSARRQLRPPSSCLRHHPRRSHLRLGLVQQALLRPATPSPSSVTTHCPRAAGDGAAVLARSAVCGGYPITTRSPSLAGDGQCPLANGPGPSDGPPSVCQIVGPRRHWRRRGRSVGRAEQLLQLADRRQRSVLWAGLQCSLPACAPSAG